MVFLYEQNLIPLELQKNRKEVDGIIKESILESIRDSIPVEKILRAYMDETTDIVATLKQENEDQKIYDYKPKMDHNMFDRGLYIGLEKGNEVDYHYGVGFEKSLRSVVMNSIRSGMEKFKDRDWKKEVSLFHLDNKEVKSNLEKLAQNLY